MVSTYQKEDVLLWLAEVMDPEIPVVSLIDLGVIREVSVDAKGKVMVEMTPTFVGCPAMDYMKKEVEQVLTDHQVKDFEVNVSFESQWSSNDITDNGRAALKKFGLAPPPKYQLIPDLEILDQVPCPYCDSDNTTLNTPFGPTLCRSMHYCHNCKQAFEQFKPL
ncbi:MAG: phenylacetate-CoA oxygenase subunit PaaJ [Cyclobacteriaceae bacterium]|nr:phenylacetate-CoA oxygenase subunit PaaJ [Cyclobacteriaceae bacterium]